MNRLKKWWKLASGLAGLVLAGVNEYLSANDAAGLFGLPPIVGNLVGFAIAAGFFFFWHHSAMKEKDAEIEGLKKELASKETAELKEERYRKALDKISQAQSERPYIRADILHTQMMALLHEWLQNSARCIGDIVGEGEANRLRRIPISGGISITTLRAFSDNAYDEISKIKSELTPVKVRPDWKPEN